MNEKIKVGISSCLLGNCVRYDGQHKHDHFITDTLGLGFEFYPICPEVECGLPIPREAMRLVGNKDEYRLKTGKTGIDHTEKLMNWCHAHFEEWKKEDLAGFIFKAKSPTSGLHHIKVYKEDGNIFSHEGQGLFARFFTENFPNIPVEDEGRLNDIGIRENFVESLFVLSRWRKAEKSDSPQAMVDFHSRHKYTFMARSQSLLKKMGPLVSNLSGSKYKENREAYFPLLLEILKIQKTLKHNHNVLLHMLGYFRKNLGSVERLELLELIESYSKGLVPLLVPLTMIKHYSRKYDQTYLEDQYFLNPHPLEMKLLYHV
jgi:uncharacterized protein YbgA (DUF1722 family)/uncharacterized protein YbbK (DUF523 family)